MELLNLTPSKAQFLSADPDNQILISCVTPSVTLYYDNTSAVSASTNDGNIVSTGTASVVLDSSVWVVPTSNMQITVEHFTGSTGGGAVDQVRLTSGTTASYGIEQGDVNLYRSAANTWTTGDALTVGGVVTPSAGIAPLSAPKQITTVPIGSVAYGSYGAEVASASNKAVYLINVFVPCNTTLTGAARLNGTAHTDKIVYYLFNNAGTKVANTLATGTDQATNDVFQEIAFTATYAAPGPANYWLGVQHNGTTAKGRYVATLTHICLAGSVTGTSFGAEASVTPPSTFTEKTGPIGYLY